MLNRLLFAGVAVTCCALLTAMDTWALDWQYTTVTSTPSVDGNLESGLQIKAAPDGTVHGMYRWNEQGQYEYRYVTFDGDSWTQRKIFNSGRSLAVDSLSHPHLAYSSGGAIRHTWWDGSDWQDELVFDAPGSIPSGAAGSVDLFIDPADGLHLAYRVTGHDDDIGQDFNAIYYTKWEDSVWDTETTVRRNGSTSGLSGPVLGIDGTGTPQISFTEGGQIKQCKPMGSTWPTSVVFTGGFSDVDMVVDAGGVAHVAWCDRTSGKDDLAYAVWNGFGWDVETVESYEDVGSALSLDLDPLCRPCISYCNRSDKDLKFARMEDGEWIREIVHGPGYNGTYTSLDVDAVGNIHILYLRAEGPIEMIGHAYHQVPEPTTMLLVGTGLAAIAALRRRRAGRGA